MALASEPLTASVPLRGHRSDIAPVLPDAALRGPGSAPSTGSPTLDCARAARFPADAPDVRSLIESMRNTAPAMASDF